MKVFISQPMAGKTDEQILGERADAFALIKSVRPDAELIDMWDEADWDEADAVWMLKGWEKAMGCKFEHDCAIAYGIPVYYLY